MNIEEAKKIFKKYVDKYDFDNDKVELKYEHSLRVSKLCREIAEHLNLSKEDIEIAEMIGLLHDFGRFEQIKIYDTFDDRISVDHAVLGVQLLEEFGIDKFIEDEEIQKLVKKAILLHNKTFIEDNLTEREILFAKIIRDADKIDIYYIWTNLEVKTVNAKVNHKIYHRLIKCKIDYEERKNDLDFYLLLMGLVYDINFEWSYKYLDDKKYINIFIDRVINKNKRNYFKLNRIKGVIKKYMKKREKLC